MSEGSKKKGPMKVSEALARYLARSGLGERLEEAASLDDWAERVGDRIAAVAEPVHVSEGVLVVAVRSSAWLMELRMMEADVRRRLNEGRSRGRIRRIHFVMAGDEGEDGAGSGPGFPRPRWNGRGRGESR